MRATVAPARIWGDDMPTPFVGQIIMFAGNYAPEGWALCDGSLLPVADYEDLFALIGTTYGGDGQETFGLPDLRGRVPIGDGQGLSNYIIGETCGVETVKLQRDHLPQHSHPVAAVHDLGNTNIPAGNVVLAALGGQAGSGEFQVAAYAPANDLLTLNPNSVSITGGDQPHENIQPYQAVNYCIALAGAMPMR